MTTFKHDSMNPSLVLVHRWALSLSFNQRAAISSLFFVFSSAKQCPVYTGLSLMLNSCSCLSGTAGSTTSYPPTGLKVGPGGQLRLPGSAESAAPCRPGGQPRPATVAPWCRCGGWRTPYRSIRADICRCRSCGNGRRSHRAAHKLLAQDIDNNF
jgi:hypothetical protein